MLGSPTVLANKEIESKLRDSAKKFGTGLYVPSGALWGGEDIRKMADLGTLKVSTIFPPCTFDSSKKLSVCLGLYKNVYY